MSKNANAPWVGKDGKVITFENCKDAVHEAISSMSKTLAEDGPIRKSQSLSIAYQRHIAVLEVVREKFDMLHKQTKKVQRKTVKKKKRMIH